MRNFHVFVHAGMQGPDECPRRIHSLEGNSIQVLQIGSNDVTRHFNVTFEQTGSALESQPLLYFEPDGSFVWVSGEPPRQWQLDGLLNDEGGRLISLELKGKCPRSIWNQVLRSLGSEPDQVIIQLAREGIFLDAAEFCRYFEIE